MINYIKSLAINTGIYGLGGVVAAQYSHILGPFVSKNCMSGIICDANATCSFGSIGPNALFCAERIQFIQPVKPLFKYVASNTGRLFSVPNALFANTKLAGLTEVPFSAFGEEVISRGFIQCVCIRGLQERVLKLLSPDHKNLIDHPITIASRVFAASIIFGLLHTELWECTLGGTTPQIFGGIIFGLLAEKSIIGATVAHTLANWIITGGYFS